MRRCLGNRESVSGRSRSGDASQREQPRLGPATVGSDCAWGSGLASPRRVPCFRGQVPWRGQPLVSPCGSREGRLCVSASSWLRLPVWPACGAEPGQSKARGEASRGRHPRISQRTAGFMGALRTDAVLAPDPGFGCRVVFQANSAGVLGERARGVRSPAAWRSLIARDERAIKGASSLQRSPIFASIAFDMVPRRVPPNSRTSAWK